ncbi:MAG: cardiolipin synthase [Thiomicrorhabdus sp.]|nr:cardiolipin synthase [Thiomicrorhabdus sp.]
MELISDLNQPAFWLYFLYTILVVAAVLHILYQRRSPQNLMAWLLTLLLLPFIGLVLYLILGSRKLFSKRKKPILNMQPISQTSPESELGVQINNILDANGLPTATHSNLIESYQDPISACKALIKEIQSAQYSIHLQTYIFDFDQTGKAIFEALITRAKEGVEVCLLMDTIGSFALYRNQKLLAPLVNAGGQFAFFQPLFKTPFNNQVNLRNHRKIYLFDGKTLLTGGMNISSDYLGCQNNSTPKKHWKDLLFKIEGPACWHYQNIFNADWKYTTNKIIRQPKVAHAHSDTAEQGQTIQVIPSGPDIDKDVLFETLLHAIFAAKNRIDIVSPYFIPDNALMNALLIAIKRGVKVTLITPQKSDHIIFDLGRSSYMRELHENHGKIYLDNSAMLHAKLILIDDECVIMGSANVDYRSLFINHEVVNYIYSQQLMKEMRDWLQQLKKHAIPYKPNHRKLHRMLENLTRIFAPIL